MKRVLIALCALLTLAACTKEMNPLESVNKGALQTIQVSVAPFGEQTKTAVTPKGKFTWSSGDQIGIYPVSSTLGEGQTSQQITFKINGTGDASSATFTGTGWGLVLGGGYKYYSYYPYDASSKCNEINVEYNVRGNQACNDTTGAECTAHLGENDFLCAPQIQPTDAASCSFAFKHLGVLVKFIITVPEDSTLDNRKFKMMEVVAEDSIFTVKGKYDPTSATSSSVPVITKLASTNKLSLNFDGTTGFEANGDDQIIAYMLIAPTAIKDKKFTVTVYDEYENAYSVTKTGGEDLTSGMLKPYNCVVNPGSGYAVNLSGNGTANCYIVPESGRYKFRANIKGNGVDPLDDTPSVYENAAIDVTDCTAEVVWETFNTNVAPAKEGLIVKDVELNGDFIEFTATGAEGNALIAIKNSSNQILWSWHIWSTSADLENLAQTYPNDAGVMMDRNLGALSATQGDNLTTGFLYQWGRPSPLRGDYSLTGNGAMTTTNNDVWTVCEVSESTGTIEYMVANPTKNINRGTTDKLSWYWGTTPALWGSKKTMYDPCPVGWKVPTGGNYGVWKVAGFNNDSFVLNSAAKGYIFTPKSAYYPFSGLINSTNGLNESYHAGYYWTSFIGSENQANSLVIVNDGVQLYIYYNATMAAGCSIRPYKDVNN